MKYLSLLIFIITVSVPAIAEPYTKTADAKKIAWMDKGMNAVKQRLKDPISTTFRNVYFHRTADNVPVTCGEVNAKNSYGAYTGFQSFISGGTLKLTILQSEVTDFPVLWNDLCQ